MLPPCSNFRPLCSRMTSLTAPAFAAIEVGDAAEAAWLSALNAEITGYETSDDDYFRGRASDLVDLRDRVLRNLSGADLEAAPPGAILAGKDVTPSRFLETDWSVGGGLALFGGSATSHVAMLARARGIPMVVGLGAIALDGHVEAMVDGDNGALVLSPGHSQRSYVEMRRAALAEDGRANAHHLYTDARTSDGVADRRDDQCRATGGDRRRRCRNLRRHRPDAHRVPVHRQHAA